MFNSFYVSLAFISAIFATPIFGPLTSTRLALVMTVGFVFVFALLKGMVFNYRILMVPCLAVVFFLTHSFSFFVAGGSVWWPVSFLLFGVLAFTLSLAVTTVRRRDLFFNTIVVFGFLFMTSILFDAYRSGVTIGINYSMRNYLNEESATGLNRQMNAAVIFGLISATTLLFRSVKTKFEAVFATFCAAVYLLAIFLSFASGSRQSVLALAAALPVAAIVELLSRGGRPRVDRFRSKVMLKIVVFLALAVFLMRFFILDLINLDLDWFTRRFAGTLLQGNATYGDTARLENIDRTLTVGELNYGFGPGPGEFLAIFGVPTENGYLSILADSGIIGAVMALPFFVLLILYLAYLNALKRDCVGKSLSTVLIVVVGVMINFNELLRDALFWGVLSIASGFVFRQTGADKRPLQDA